MSKDARAVMTFGSADPQMLDRTFDFRPKQQQKSCRSLRRYFKEQEACQLYFISIG